MREETGREYKFYNCRNLLQFFPHPKDQSSFSSDSTAIQQEVVLHAGCRTACISMKIFNVNMYLGCGDMLYFTPWIMVKSSENWGYQLSW